ncbi:uncharacterized protein F4807DRAFT_7560 [Annulohypoxylon truncatum]|uniref:uncharacterized protein n=1 Tax=Annulohypoxylon truncatum TaxID=327061 RepID=UPI00200764BB|nr:uncharacterized protein F4807DRAFT_7560 [Annulohypoxylon truncatum]KAI1214744.1 hypothetical protein F4807DRAFT_7560 [Annulohypoxylon truncatum]
MPSILRRFVEKGKFKREKEKRKQIADNRTDDESPKAEEEPDRASLNDGLGALAFLDDCEDHSNGIDLVFVHGLRGSRFKTWSKGDIFWPRDFLKDDLKKARIITWGYDANIANAFSYASRESLFGHANTLLNDLARLRRGITRPIIFVCHSFGGLVVKEALITSDNYRNHNRHPTRGAIYAKTIGVIFMGTPHQGSSKESYGEIVANIAYMSFRQPNKQLLRTLKPYSHVLEKQRNDFTTISNEMSIVCIREELPTGAGIIVPGDSAWQCSFGVILDSVHANHMDMVKFSTKDENYRKVLGYMEEIRDANTSGADPEMVESLSNEILRTLKSFMIGNRRQGIDDAYANTCSWIFESESQDNETTAESGQFLSWLQNDNPFFWVSGKAGCGKSTLMKYMHEDKRTEAALKDSLWTEAKELILIGHFFYDRGNDNQKSREGMLRSILFHILQIHRKLIPKSFPIFFEGKGRVDISSWVIDWGNLSEAFFSMLKHLQNTKICLFLDGLDEYRMVGRTNEYTEEELDLIYDGENEDEAWGLSPWITNGHKEIAHFIHGLGASGNIKVCLSSRELNVFEHEFRDFPRIRVHEHTSESIVQYCRGNLTKAAPDLDGLMEFVSKIAGRSCGVFLWVRIVVGMLIDGYTEGNSENDLWKVLNALPKRLGGDDGLYMRMMKNVRREYLSESRRLFQLVSKSERREYLLELNALLELGSRDLSFAHAPLDIITLFLAEEWHLEDGEQELRAKTDKYQPKTWDEMKHKWKARERRLKSRCGGLLEGTEEVQFMHQTAKEFISRAYLNNKIFQNAVGFSTEFDIHLAIMSGYIRRLKRCAEVVVTPDKVQINPQIQNITTNPFETIEMSSTAPVLFQDIFLNASCLERMNMESDAYRPYIKLLDELDIVGGQLVASLEDLSYLGFTWFDVYLANGSPSQGSGFFPRVQSFLQLAFLIGLTPYIRAKVNGQRLRKDQLDFFLLQISRHPTVSLRHVYPDIHNTSKPEIFELLFEEGAEPNCRVSDPTWKLQDGWTAWTCHLAQDRNIRHSKTSERWDTITKLFLRFGADPTAHIFEEGKRLTAEDVLKNALAKHWDFQKDLDEILELLNQAKTKRDLGELAALG